MFEKIDEKIDKLSDCYYPDCELCFAFKGNMCTVPIVVDKQSYIELRLEIDKTIRDITKIENALYDEILGQKAGAPKEIYERVAYGLPDDYDNEVKGE